MNNEKWVVRGLIKNQGCSSEGLEKEIFEKLSSHGLKLPWKYLLIHYGGSRIKVGVKAGSETSLISLCDELRGEGYIESHDVGEQNSMGAELMALGTRCRELLREEISNWIDNQELPDVTRVRYSMEPLLILEDNLDTINPILHFITNPLGYEKEFGIYWNLATEIYKEVRKKAREEPNEVARREARELTQRLQSIIEGTDLSPP